MEGMQEATSRSKVTSESHHTDSLRIHRTRGAPRAPLYCARLTRCCNLGTLPTGPQLLPTLQFPQFPPFYPGVLTGAACCWLENIND